MDEPRISVLGTSGLLLEAPGELSVAAQQRIWGLAEQVRTWDGVREVVPGMTNLLLLFAGSGDAGGSAARGVGYRA